MRKLTIAGALLVALVATSVAVAHGIEGARSTKAIAATFSATQTSTSSKTCTTTDGKTIVVTDGKYTGTASGGADLAGTITLRARSVIDTTDKLGKVSGAFKVDVASGRDTVGAWSAVYDDGSIAGLATARANEPAAHIIGNLSATFDPASGFSNGKIGGGTAGGSAIELSGGSCKSAAPTKETSEAHGTVSAVSLTSITVAGLTCSTSGDLAAKLNNALKVGDRAEIRCKLVNGQNTLVSFSSGKHH